MGRARHPLSLALTVSAISICLIAALLGGCGSSDENGTGSDSATSGTTDSRAGAKAPAGAAVQGCGGTGESIADLRVTGVGCAVGRSVVATWSGKPECSAPGTSRVSCTAAEYRCLGARTDRGLVVSCARPGRSISFVAKTG
jgi:hypothetical protein